MNPDDDRPVWRLGRISGVITLVWFALWGTALAILGSDRRAYSTLVRLSGNIGARVFFGVVVFAAVLHAVDGIGRLRPSADPERWRAAAWFAACGVGIPALVVLVWPFVESRL